MYSDRVFIIYIIYEYQFQQRHSTNTHTQAINVIECDVKLIENCDRETSIMRQKIYIKSPGYTYSMMRNYCNI